MFFFHKSSKIDYNRIQTLCLISWENDNRKNIFFIVLRLNFEEMHIHVRLINTFFMVICDLRFNGFR